MADPMFWHAVALSRKIKSKPVRIMFEDEPIVLFRNKDGLNCLRDICPHRGASLSKGRLVGDSIECPYHGWQFNGHGRCTHIPFYMGETPQRFVRPYNVCEKYGLVFITRNKDKAQPIAEPVWDGQKSVSIIMENTAIATTLADIAENALDPSHAAFVHKGLVRGAAGAKNRLSVSAAVENGTLIIRHQGEKKQNGLIPRLLEGERSHAINRFSMPGNLSLEYYSTKGLNMVFTIYFTRSHGNHFMMFAIMRGPKQMGFGYLKAILFIPVIRKVFEQDKEIMADAAENMRLLDQQSYARSPLDIFRSMIDNIIAAKGDPINIDEAKIDIEL